MSQEKLSHWLAPMHVGKIWGVGKKSAEILERMGIYTVGDLQKLSMDCLCQKFGKQGSVLYHLCRGADSRPVGGGEPVKSISREHTFNADSRNFEEWKETLFTLSQDVSRRARRYGVKGSTVFLTWRRPDFSRHSQRKTLVQPSNSAKLLYENSLELLVRAKEPVLRLLGLGITGLENAMQTDLFSQKELEMLEAAEAAMDRIVEKFGRESIGKGREIGGDRKH